MKKNLILASILTLFSLCAFAQTRGLYVPDNNGGVAAPSNEKRYALVIGNNAYQSVSSLKNPINDAVDMAEVLKSLGFEVETLTNTGLVALNNAIRRLGNKARGQNAVALFFYSGHGLQVNNDNWLVPVDAESQSPADVQSACVSLKFLMDQLEQANTGTNIVILDACRNNPFSYSRSSGGGLAQPSKTPMGTYIAFATAPYTTASDGMGRNSPYTSALKTAMQSPNIKIEDMFKQVRREVKQTGQTPWENSSLEGDFYFNPQPNAVVEKPSPQPTPSVPIIPSRLSKEPEMVFVKGGNFQMGSNDYENEKPIHKVTLSSYHIGKYEVTQKQWREIMGSDPPKLSFEGCDNCPVENVSWNDVQDFLKKLNAMSSNKKYRLPTEREWEYAAKGGNQSKGYKYSGSNKFEDVAWCGNNAGDKTYHIGIKQANELGIHDMSGNVLEWCSNDYNSYYPNGSPTNSNKAPSATCKIIRGGSYFFSQDFCRVSHRDCNDPRSQDDILGFRLAHDD
jgi:formylglycine-generating enzyme required for sulfatase activity